MEAIFRKLLPHLESSNLGLNVNLKSQGPGMEHVCLRKPVQRGWEANFEAAVANNYYVEALQNRGVCVWGGL